MRRPLCWMCVWIAGTLAAVLAGAVSVNGADETVTLRYRFEPGQSVYYRVDNESQFQVQFGTADETVKHSSQSLKHYTVISVEQDGSAVIELAIDRAQMQAVQNGGKATYDSASNQEPPEAFKGIQETIGRPWVRLHVTATGRVTRAVQIGKLPGKNGAGDEASMVDKPSDESMIQVLSVMPDKPVSVGSVWQDDYEASVMASPMLQKPVKMQRQYKLLGVTKGVAQIECTTLVLTPLREPAEEAQLIQKTPKGTLTFEIASGLMVERDLRVKNSVIGFQGAQSKLTVETVNHDRLVPADKVAAEKVSPIRAASATSEQGR